jgi:hypothetical protein
MTSQHCAMPRQAAADPVSGPPWAAGCVSSICISMRAIISSRGLGGLISIGHSPLSLLGNYRVSRSLNITQECMSKWHGARQFDASLGARPTRHARVGSAARALGGEGAA